MKNGAISVFSVVGLFICLSLQTSLIAQTTDFKDTIAKEYPYLSVDPSVPIPGKAITLDFILGINPDGCVPKYTTSIETSISKSNPPLIQVYLDYNEVPFDSEGIGCITVLTPYGPSFDIGTAVVGTYKIYVKNSLITEFKVGDFIDTTNSVTYPYSVITPQVPKIGDSVSVRLFLGEESSSCVLTYQSKIVSHEIQEKYPPTHIIQVEYEALAVNCYDMWCESIKTQYGPKFDLGKVETGTYLVYNKEQLVTKFSVGDTSSSSIPLKFTPEQPVEGDSLSINQILGYGSSSCSPLYTTSYKVVSEGNGQFTYELSYVVTDRSKNEVCTADYRAYGPTWVIPSVKAGYYLFNLDKNNYLKVIVNKKQVTPSFTQATIKGVVGFSSIIDAEMRSTISQCTVAVVSYQLTTDKRIVSEGCATESDSTSNSENSIKCSISKYIAVTDGNGSFTIKDIPVSELMDNAYIVAVKGDSVGYAVIPSPLKEEMIFDIPVYDYKIVVDTVKIAESDEIVALFRALSTVVRPDLKGSAKTVYPSISTMSDGIQFSIPTAQNISVSAFSMNGKLLWNKDQGVLTAGVHRFHFPKASGAVLVKIKGETFVLSRVIKITK
jgi:hypothetical protein